MNTSPSGLKRLAFVATGDEDEGQLGVLHRHAAEDLALREPLRHQVLDALRDQDVLGFQLLDQEVEGIALLLRCPEFHGAEIKCCHQLRRVLDDGRRGLLEHADDGVSVECLVLPHPVLLELEVLDDELYLREVHVMPRVHGELALGTEALKEPLLLDAELLVDHIAGSEEQRVWDLSLAGVLDQSLKEMEPVSSAFVTWA